LESVTAELNESDKKLKEIGLIEAYYPGSKF
jgi:hypothetical protein